MTKDGQGQIAAVEPGLTVLLALRIRTLTERDRVQARFANQANGDCLRTLEKSVHVVPLNKLFTFDHVFGPDTRQSDIFSALGQRLINKFVEGECCSGSYTPNDQSVGYNVTILAYGQTSSGKTYTMGTAQHGSRFDPEQEGLVPRAMSLLFDLLQQNDTRPTSPSSVSSNDFSHKSQRLRPVSRLSSPAATTVGQLRYRYTVKVSFVEIYNEDLIDLLNSAPPSERPLVTIREDTKGHIYWTGVKEVSVTNTEDVLYHLQQGTLNRSTGATDMNEQSSRSHAIFAVTLKQERWVASSIGRSASPGASKLSKRPMSAMNARTDEGEWIVTTSKLNFVDLAGSERLKRTAAEGDRRKEGISINGGLLALGNVISALGDPSKRSTHIPYRDSKLTRLLQDSLGGSATTLMIACASPSETNLAETINTLQYANRARNIKNKVEKNEAEEWMTTDNIELLRTIVGKLKSASRKDDGLASPIHNADLDQNYDEQRALMADLQRQVEEYEGQVSVTLERNRVVEEELKRLRTSESMWKNEYELKTSQDLDFQHLVEPVIEEYEKSISALESQLAMAQAAINHSDYGFHEQLAKQEQCEIVIESQEQTIMDLRLRLSKVLEREHSNEAYIEELEEKLRHSTRDAVRDQEHLNELRSRVMKLREVDESTENYIASLEQRGAAADAERATLAVKIEELEARLAEQKPTPVEPTEENKAEENQAAFQELTESFRILQEDYQETTKELDEVLARYQESLEQIEYLRANPRNDGDMSQVKAVAYLKERKVLHQQVDRLEQNVRALQSQLVQTQQEQSAVRDVEGASDTLGRVSTLPLQDANISQEEKANQEITDLKTTHQAQISILTASVKRLEFELATSSERIRIFEQMSEDQQEAAELERGLQSIDKEEEEMRRQEEAYKDAQLTQAREQLKKAQQKIVHLQRQTEKQESGEESKDNSMVSLHVNCKGLLGSYDAQSKQLSVVLERAKSLLTLDSEYTKEGEFKHVIINLSQQMAEQQECMRVEAQAFRNDVRDLTTKNRRLEKELGLLRRKANGQQPSRQLHMTSFSESNRSTEHTSDFGQTTPTGSLSASSSRRQSMVSMSDSYLSNGTTSPTSPMTPTPASTPLASPAFHHASTEIMNKYEKNLQLFKSRISVAEQDIRIHQAINRKLDIKTQSVEESLLLLQCQSKEAQPDRVVSDGEIEELMQRMNAMKIQREAKPGSQTSVGQVL
ncbi:hypothetical protein BDF14DRAFT_1883802 [Spinellus fusiger]|nr:hypothetical protein BDF14DRAFT_1883802 [Spinellus fusiger]